jgi:hypothetical protein
MAMTDERIEAKFQALIDEGHGILQQHGWDGRQFHRFIPSGLDYHRWRTEAMNLIERVCGRTSSHYEAIRRIAEGAGTALNSLYLTHCVGVLEAARRDYADGFLAGIRLLVRADLLDDFLTQAEFLVGQGYHVAAVSLAGAVLEDTLRKLCDKYSISCSGKAGIEALNVEFGRQEVYSKLVQKEITAKAHLRNSADHGEFDAVLVADSEDMVRWVRRFVTEYLQ